LQQFLVRQFLAHIMLIPQIHNADQILERFRLRFGKSGRVFRAPGRVNIIGEHTDYNQGFVLPAAIEFSCWVASSSRDDEKIVVYSENFDELVEVGTGSIGHWPRDGWAAYPLGVGWALEQAGFHIPGCNLYIAGDVPLGAGLSSSAAIEVATLLALLDLSGAELDRTKAALLCQHAENDFVGARCGIMDQFIASNGRAAHCILLDCRSLKGRAIPLPPDVLLVVCNSMVKHELAATEYNKRREECEEAVRLLKTALPTIHALRDVSVGQLEMHKKLLPGLIYQRARHVVTEDQRTLLTARALEQGSFGGVREWMAESHKSLRDDYEVSCRELDLLVEIAGAQKGVLGARMTGGGFGGCTINLVKHEFVSSFIRGVEVEYLRRTGLRPEILSMRAADAARLAK
jgi:galactokinase